MRRYSIGNTPALDSSLTPYLGFGLMETVDICG